MKKTVLFLLLLCVFGCSQEPEVIHLRTVKGSRNVKSTIHANQLMTVQIEGMTCEMGCGGSIRKALKATGGVARVSFDFVEGRKIQSAQVYIDSTKVSSSTLNRLIQTINEKQFKTYQLSTEQIQSSASMSSSSSSEREQVKMNEENIAIPNLLDLLSGFVL